MGIQARCTNRDFRRYGGRVPVNTELYEAVLSSIQDGISVLKPDFKIIYVNKSMLHWYPGEDNVLGQKCYEVFHGRTEPCVCCPTIRAVRTAAPQMDLVPYTTDGEDSGWQKLYAVPVLDKTAMLCWLSSIFATLPSKNAWKPI